jgi:hypothetical protein
MPEFNLNISSNICLYTQKILSSGAEAYKDGVPRV